MEREDVGSKLVRSAPGAGSAAPTPDRIDALTSCRFFAAAAIVLHHSRGLFGLPGDLDAVVPLDHAVAFFFVLSGFVLTHVYGRLEGRRSVGPFLAARFARLWPAHALTFALSIALSLGTLQWDGWIAPANLLLLHAWVPERGWFFSYNGASWSLSTELGFYLLFPLLARNFERTWHLKLAGALALSLGIVVAAELLGLPATAEVDRIACDGLIYVNPLARLFQFVLGMCSALAYRSVRRRALSPRLCTLFEALALLVAFAACTSTNPALRWAARLEPNGAAVQTWIAHGGLSSFAFAAVIAAIALQRGRLARLLALRPCVVLGEISFAMYLLQPLLFAVWRQFGSGVLDLDEYLLFWLTLLALSHLTWVGVERPLRVSLLRAFGVRREIHGSKVRRRWLLPTFEAVAVALILGSSLGHQRQEQRDFDWTGLVVRTPEALRGHRFGGSFELVGAEFEPRPTGLELRLGWESRNAARLDHWVAIHLLDAQGRIITQADFPQSLFGSAVAAGHRWHNRVLLVPPPGAVAVGLALFQRGSPGLPPLPVDGGPRDWDGYRLRILLPHPAEG